MTNIIESQRHNLINFKPEIEFSDISIALQLRESAYDKFATLMGGTCNLILDNLRFEDESPMRFEHILEKEKYWLCTNCNKVRLNLKPFRKLRLKKSFVIPAKYSNHLKCTGIYYLTLKMLLKKNSNH